MATEKIVHVCSDINELLNKNRNVNVAYVHLDVKVSDGVEGGSKGYEAQHDDLAAVRLMFGVESLTPGD